MVSFSFQQDNDPKQTLMKWFKDKSIEVAIKNPDFNPTEKHD